MKRKRHFGIQYNFLIELDTEENGILDIWAKNRKTKQISPITNLNSIISEIKSENDHHDLYYESSWIFTDKSEAIKTYNRAIDLFQNKLFVKYLEVNLDEDRQLGGWNSDYYF
ncbi:MAG: hypothetical protein KJ799_04630 [Bacteroidetes bacterium]|nr:hypothetical protein [Bacteroidota bacterium]MBU1679562.1 hypothetical protein [Bacteroidota bacterium]MBU2505993.1 hypothetical protein [Bacteroidota bacterium]